MYWALIFALIGSVKLFRLDVILEWFIVLFWCYWLVLIELELLLFELRFWVWFEPFVTVAWFAFCWLLLICPVMFAVLFLFCVEFWLAFIAPMVLFRLELFWPAVWLLPVDTFEFDVFPLFELPAPTFGEAKMRTTLRNFMLFDGKNQKFNTLSESYEDWIIRAIFGF